MLRTLIRKEILANVTSLRFVLTLLLVAIVFIVSALVFVGRYEQEMRDFSHTSNRSLSGLEEGAERLSQVPGYVQTFRKRPKLMQLCCEGFEKSIPNTFRMNAFTMEYPEIVSGASPLFPRFADMDWTFIISLILSFAALLMTFDSLSGEKERGTLRLVMSGPVSRDKIVLGKYVSGVLTLMIPLSIGILLNLISLSFFGLSFTSFAQWMRILAFVGVSTLYLSIFVFLGILVSSRSAKSSSSIVVLLFLWVIITMIIPSSGRMVADRFIRVPTRLEVERHIKEARDEIWENKERYGRNVGFWIGGANDPRNNPSGRAKMENAMTEAKNRIGEAYINKMLAQVSLGRNATRISPAVIYQCASEAIMGTGVARSQNLYNQLKIYRQVLRDFVMNIDRRDPDSLHLWVEPEYLRRRLLSRKPVDRDTIPRFQEIGLPMASTLRRAAWDIGALALLNILLFMGCYISFLRSDVR